MLISKTTVAGYLSASLALATYVAAGPQEIIPHHVGVWILFVVGGARIILGHKQEDADQTKARTPSGAVQTVPAHPVPDNPADQAVPK